MKLNIEIGPYTLSRRTEYSKFQLFNRYTGENITNGNEDVLEKIISDYNFQEKYPDKCFEIESGVFKKVIAKNKINFLFIPEGVKKISHASFNTSFIEEVYIPDSVVYIGDYAFENSTYLKSISLPDSVQHVGTATFRNCKNLENIKLSMNLKELGTFVFDGCSSLKKIVLPNEISVISSHSFSGCKKLKSVKLPNKLKGIHNSAFDGCKSLQEIDFPSTLEVLDTSCFANCTSLKEVRIPYGVHTLESKIFAGCTNLEYVELPHKIYVLSEGLFSNCTNLKTVIVPDQIKSIYDDVFYNTRALGSINIPKNLINTSFPLFDNSSIKTLIINDNLMNIKNIELFSGFTKEELDLLSKSNIEKLVIKGRVQTIDWRLFKFSGAQIKEIDYLGSENKFIKFKQNNKLFFEKLSNLKKINFLEESLELQRENVKDGRIHYGI